MTVDGLGIVQAPARQEFIAAVPAARGAGAGSLRALVPGC